MTADWVFSFPLTAAERELVLSRIRPALWDAPTGNPLTEMLRLLEEQVAGGGDEIRLPVGRLDLIGKLHWSRLLSGLSTPTGRVRCSSCKGLGEVDLPHVLLNLAGRFDYDFSLSALGGPERVVYLEQSPDPAVRERQAAERKAELERQRDALYRSEQRSYGVLPGTPRESAPAAADRDFMPARGR